jgi:GNAT superfamily N-acetyltransferase
MLIDKKNIKICSAFDVSENQLVEFYKKAFANRADYFSKNWKWINRTDFFDKKTPIVLEYQNNVIAHSGLMPVWITNSENQKFTASWYIDFKVLDDYQNHGLGGILVKKWVTFADASIAFCNDYSIRVFKKNGWTESFDTFRHICLVNLFSHPAFLRKFPKIISNCLNFVTYPFVYLYYKFKNSGKNDYKLEKLVPENFAFFYNLYKKHLLFEKNTNYVLRDENFVKWRLASSPNREHYFVYQKSDFAAVVLIHSNHGKYIDVMWVTDTNNAVEIAKMIGSLAIYGINKGIAYIRFYTSKIKVSNYIKNKALTKIQHPRFAYFSTNPTLYQKIKSQKWDLELIDSDFEHFS